MGTTATPEQAAQIVQRHFAGDDTALNELMGIFRGLVVAAARRVLHSSADVDDAVQETWLSFVRFGNNIADPQRVGAWLWTVALNSARRIQRSNGRCVVADDVVELADAEGTDIDFDSALVRNEQREAVARAARDMRDGDRQLLDLLMDEHSYDYHEISRLSGRPIGSLGPTRERIIRKLRSTPCVADLLVAV